MLSKRNPPDIGHTRHLPRGAAILNLGKWHRRDLREGSWEVCGAAEIAPSGIVRALW